MEVTSSGVGSFDWQEKTKKEERELDSVVVESEDDTEEFCYPNNNRKQGKSRGLSLILSMEKCRPGAGVDRGRLETLSLACGFTEVQRCVDLTASELVVILDKVAQLGFREEDECFLCFINANGGTTFDGESYIVDENGQEIMVTQHIIEPFRHSKHLLGKPKVFFVNCCRTNCSVEDDDDYQQGTGSLRRPFLELSDCLVVFSTSGGCRSGRYADEATIFVDKLVETVMMKRQTMDVLSMIHNVNSPALEVIHSLRKRLYWKDT